MAGSWFSASGFQTYAAQAVAIAEQYGIPVSLFLNQIAEESGFTNNRTSPTGASGIAQIEPYTARAPGYGISPVNAGDPTAALNFMAQYDKAMYQRTGSWTSALEAYNGGLGHVLNGSVSSAAKKYASDILGGIWNGAIQAAGGVPNAVADVAGTGNIGAAGVTGNGPVAPGTGVTGGSPGLGSVAPTTSIIGTGAAIASAAGLPGGAAAASASTGGGAVASGILGGIASFFGADPKSVISGAQDFLLIVLGIVLLLGAIFLLVNGQSSNSQSNIMVTLAKAFK